MDKKSENDNNLDEVAETNKGKEATNIEDKNDHGSIESVPFISQPAKKKICKN